MDICEVCESLNFDVNYTVPHNNCSEYFSNMMDTQSVYAIFYNNRSHQPLMYVNGHCDKFTLTMDNIQTYISKYNIVLNNVVRTDYINLDIAPGEIPANMEIVALCYNAGYASGSHCDKCDDVLCACLSDEYCCNVITCSIHKILMPMEHCTSCFQFTPMLYDTTCVSCTLHCSNCSEIIIWSGHCVKCRSEYCYKHSTDMVCNDCIQECWECNAALTRNEYSFCAICISYECIIQNHRSEYAHCNKCLFMPDEDENILTMMANSNYYILVKNPADIIKYAQSDTITISGTIRDIYIASLVNDRWYFVSAKTFNKRLKQTRHF